MARPLRLELAGGLYHVTARGDRREAIYFSERDRNLWLDLLGEVCSVHNWRRHAWCQMTNGGPGSGLTIQHFVNEQGLR